MTVTESTQLSPVMVEVLADLLTGRAALTPLVQRTRATKLAMTSLHRRGFIHVTGCGSLDPIVTITDAGTDAYRAYVAAEMHW